MLSKEVAHCALSARRLATVFMTLVSVFSGYHVNANGAEANIEQITGVVVAYDEVKPSLTCIEICETSLIVRIEEPSESRSNYIRIDLKFKERKKFPKELITNNRRWRFKLVRTVARDEKMEEFILGQDVYGKDFKSPIWTRVPGAEEEKLPFGEVLRSYSLLKRGFKAAGD